MQEGNALIKADIMGMLNLESGMHVGDMGCGNLGFFTLPAAKIVGKDGMVYAVDILKSVLAAVENLARQEGMNNIKIVWSNLEILGATKIPESSLDAALVVNMLFQSKRDDLVLRETVRLLKKNAKVIIVDWLKIATPFGPSVADRTDPSVIKKFATDAGLKLMEEFEAGPYHYGLLLTKGYK